ncbi:hypothetical protein [Saccharothrix sp. Mg75]|uniref:hypothetical protein n=1 Tax=Saccharothrix sp. Mg75 TaxID=3445357 RepID=UPI003EED9F75
MNQPATATSLEVEISHGQVYIYSAAPWASDPDGHNAVLRALDDAHRSGRYVGTSAGLIDLVTPVEWNFTAPMRVETWADEPSLDDADWDHVVDVDLDVSDGILSFEGSGGRPPIPCEVPTGKYRARIAGRGYEQATQGVDGMDDYRIQLWKRDSDQAPTLRKRWNGWGAWQR